MTVLDCIGRTRIAALRHIVPAGSAGILLKLEYENPTGSMKDRMALAMVEAAVAVQLLSRQSFSAAMAGSTPKPRATYEPVPRSR